MHKPLPYSFLLLIFIFSFCTCGKEKKDTPIPQAPTTIIRDLEDIISTDTLRVATIHGATSYFLFRKEAMGYNYELIKDFAKHLKVKLDIQVVNTEKELVNLISNGEIDLVAYNLYKTIELKKDFHFVYPQTESHQVLIQRIGRNSLLEASDLADKNVHVKEHSIYHKRLSYLNEEIGGTINIIFANDSLSNDDLIEMVLEEKIDYTIAYYKDAALHRTYSQKLDYHVPLGFTQQSGWLIRKDTPSLLEAFEAWSKLPATNRLEQRLESKYMTRNPYLASQNINIPDGAISPYDDLFKKYAPAIGWDWRLLASIAFHESTFNANRVSHAGAAGLMQLMPRTGEIYGLDSITILDPEENIKASVEYLKELSKLFRQIENKDERIKFMLAGYNGGPYHIVDAMALTEKYGGNPHIWFDNVEYFLIQKKVPEFYQDSVVKYGSFNARETVRYVENTLSTYRKYLKES